MYTNLDVSLHAVADRALEFLAAETGHPVKAFKIETALHKDVPLVPTFSIEAEGASVYYDVSSVGFPAHFSSVVHLCAKDGLPVKLFSVVWLEDATRNVPADQIIQAKQHGTGIVTVTAGGGDILVPARVLSLTAVRHPSLKEYPTVWRPKVASFKSKYDAGEAADALKAVCDEIEHLTRTLASKVSALAAWKPGRTNATDYQVKKHEPWRKVVEDLRSHMDSAKAKLPKVNSTLLSRIEVIADIRNGVGHKPLSYAQRKQRDNRLRTGYEQAHDLLKDLLAALAPLRPKP